MTFRVLHVCTGNICRSPMGEHLMREGLRTRLGAASDAFVVESAGTWGHTGAPMEPFALSVLTTYGHDGSAFQARELVAEHVAGADLVLGATREHRAAAVVLQPRAARKTFTLREFDRLLTGVDPLSLPAGDLVARAQAVVVGAASQRGLIRADKPEDDDLVDPYQAPESAFVACAALVDTSLARLLDLLAS
jgi:protein-tyrosine phosphatase